ncbi:hypothetical protein SETIT_9G114500v2 [Setaria italica]|uniref:Uncharacterized protein n=1 Tax=Setaria italica TaxID=4555 RepID=A0A368SFG1_SETIT|nr:hypothetical protein SETIT_9G114500v2 [Setaria italica]
MSSSALDANEKTRGRVVAAVAQGEQAPRPPHEPGSFTDSPPVLPDDGADGRRPVIELRTAPTDFRLPTQNHR